MLVPLIIFRAPLIPIWCGWIMLYLDWRLEVHRPRALFALLMATVPVLLASGARAYASFVSPFPPQDYTLERWGILLSAIAVVAAYSSLWCTKRRILWLTLPVSIYTFLLWCLMGLTI